MTHAKRALWTVSAGFLIAAAAACSSLEMSADSDERAPGSTGPDSGSSGAPSADGTGAAPTATGVIVVHSAAFPSFRLCFSNYPDLVPQPDTNVMPEANVVGVEVGSLVRLDPIVREPGTVYVIDEREVRSPPGNTKAVKCGELLLPPEKRTDRTLTLNNDYHVASVIDRPLGSSQVSVLAITGCGSQAFLSSLGLSSAGCGAGWDPTSGNLEAKVVDLSTTPEGATKTTLPVQLFQMSRALDTFKGDAGKLEVTFGELAQGNGNAPLDQTVAIGDVFTGGPQTALSLDQGEQSAPAVYGSFGFRVTITSAAETVTTDQSLAAVQELSAPRALPTDYYLAGSNYALLLLGDPTHKPTYADGGANPLYNPRQSVHLLAVPVLDPAKADAGTDDAGAEPEPSSDGGT